MQDQTNNPRDERETERPRMGRLYGSQVGDPTNFAVVPTGDGFDFDIVQGDGGLTDAELAPAELLRRDIVQADGTVGAVVSVPNDYWRNRSQLPQQAVALVNSKGLALLPGSHAENVLQRIITEVEVTDEYMPDSLIGAVAELRGMLKGDTEHTNRAPEAAEVVNDPELHKKALAEAMAKENRLATPPVAKSSDPRDLAEYMHEVAKYDERKRGEHDALDQAYADGFAKGQENMAEQGKGAYKLQERLAKDWRECAERCEAELLRLQRMPLWQVIVDRFKAWLR